MKTFVRILAIFLATGAMIAALVIFARPREIDYLDRLEFAESELTLYPGEQASPELIFAPRRFSGTVTWSCSDISVALIDSAGGITAVRCGTADITAQAGGQTAHITLTVKGGIISEAQAAISALSSSAGDGAILIAAQVICDRLQSSSDDGAPEMRELLRQILAFAYGNGDPGALESAISAADGDRMLCRTAASACYAYGERESGAVLSFTGDVTLAYFNGDDDGRRFPSIFEESGSTTYPFDRVRGIFSCDDLTVVNFEGTLTNSTKHADKPFYFRGEPRYASILTESYIEAANLENNHSGDYFDTGFRDTVQHLGAAKVSPFYAGSPLSVTISGADRDIPVVLIAAKGTGDKYTDAVHRSVLDEIAKYRGDAGVIVNLHWGHETDTVPSQAQIERAHELIDAGAMLVVGNHPHVMQGIERYHGGVIAYSLGNFAFGGNGSVSSPETVILRARISRDEGGIRVSDISAFPCYTTSTGTSVNNYQPELLFGADADAVISTLLSRSASLPYGITDIARSGI